jgi:hypothetical protein
MIACILCGGIIEAIIVGIVVGIVWLWKWIKRRILGCKIIDQHEIGKANEHNGCKSCLCGPYKRDREH